MKPWLRKYIGKDVANGERLTASMVRTMGIILEMAQNGQAMTMRAVANRASRNHTKIQRDIEVLRQDGLVSFSSGSATIRPTCVFLYV